MNYYNEIKNKLIDDEIYSRVKDYSKEKHRVITYFEIGKLLNEAGGKYGDNVIEEYSKKLVAEVGKKYNRRTLFRMKKLYIVFSNKKVTTLLTQLTWSHYLLRYVVVELKVVGIIICKKNNKYLIEYCSDERIIAREYSLM